MSLLYFCRNYLLDKIYKLIKWNFFHFVSNEIFLCQKKSSIKINR